MGRVYHQVIHNFEALGTQFHIRAEVASQNQADQLWPKLEKKTAEFERRFSRFIDDSEVNQFRTATPGSYPISNEFFELLAIASRLRKATGGKFDPAVATLLEDAGYDARYSFTQTSRKNGRPLAHWDVDASTQTLSIGGPIVFDLGGFGKGYWIDQLAKELANYGVEHYLVDGGGDIAATTKSTNDAYGIALEWPGKPDTAIGRLDLLHQGFAASDVFKRSWGKTHHIIDIVQNRAVGHVLGAFAVAQDALTADMMTSTLMLCQPDKYPKLAQELGGEYLVVLADTTIKVSPGWPGEVFSA